MTYSIQGTPSTRVRELQLRNEIANKLRQLAVLIQYPETIGVESQTTPVQRLSTPMLKALARIEKRPVAMRTSLRGTYTADKLMHLELAWGSGTASWKVLKITPKGKAALVASREITMFPKRPDSGDGWSPPKLSKNEAHCLELISRDDRRISMNGVGPTFVRPQMARTLEKLELVTISQPSRGAKYRLAMITPKGITTAKANRRKTWRR